MAGEDFPISPRVKNVRISVLELPQGIDLTKKTLPRNSRWVELWTVEGQTNAITCKLAFNGDTSPKTVKIILLRVVPLNGLTKEGTRPNDPHSEFLKAWQSLPTFKETLKGFYEVNVVNPNDFLVIAGVRSGDSGRNVAIRANGGGSIFVPNGKYDIYFVYPDNPEDLYQGGGLTISGRGIQITITKAVNGSYGIRKVK